MTAFSNHSQLKALDSDPTENSTQAQKTNKQNQLHEVSSVPLRKYRIYFFLLNKTIRKILFE